MRDLKIFEASVKQWLEPIAHRYQWPSAMVDEGIYEISSPIFILRARLHTGHSRGLNVMIRPASSASSDESPYATELGIGWFATFHGESFSTSLTGVEGDFSKQTELFAQAAERYAVPMMLGQQNDFEAVRKMVRARTEEDLR